MHCRSLWTLMLIALCCAGNVAGNRALRRAQSSVSITSISATGTATPTTATATRHGTSDDTIASKTTHHALTHTSTGKDVRSATASPEAHDADSNELPLRPILTPAIGIAGAILILTGLAYAAIGIRHEWLLVFLGAAYAASLGVTILVVYLMNPPVSDTLQGVYLVAAVLTGLAFGGVALLFKDIAGGLGCLVAGFCLAMWFLTLKTGGLVTSTTDKAVVVSLFSAAWWALSFPKYTKSYALISGTSFAGATATVLGVDCFSRVGLKEFWIYIWGLNDDEFPLHTTTYPITRGMRAEIACTTVLFILTMVVQLKGWKHVKERRARKEEARRQDETQKSERDSRFGMGLLRRNTSSLANWENMYGDKGASSGHVESENGYSTNSKSKSVCVTVREDDALAMEPLEPPISSRHHRHQSNGPYSIAATAGEEEEDSEPTPSIRRSEAESLHGEENFVGNSDTVVEKDIAETIHEVPLDVTDEEELLRPLHTTESQDRSLARSSSKREQSCEASTAPASWRDNSVVDNTHRTSKWAWESNSFLLTKRRSEPIEGITSAKRRNTVENSSRRLSSTPIYSSQRQRSSTSATQSKRGTRCVSSPLIQQVLVESPVEEEFSAGSTLMNERDVRVKKRPTTVNFNAFIPPSSADLASSSEPPLSGDNSADEAEMTLSQRKTLIQQGQIRISSSSDQASISSSTRRSSSTTQDPYSHQPQPQRSFSTPQINVQPPPDSSTRSSSSSSQLAQWRHSLHQPSSSRQTLLAEQYNPTAAFTSNRTPIRVHSYPSASTLAPGPATAQKTPTSPPEQYALHARQSIAQQLRYQDYRDQAQRVEKRERESRGEMAMRTGRMTDAHRNAMRRMQAEANRSLKHV